MPETDSNSITDDFAHPDFIVTAWPQVGTDYRFKVELPNSDGQYNLAIGSTTFAVWRGETELTPQQAAEKLAEKLNVVVGGNPSQNYFFNEHNCRDTDSPNILPLEDILRAIVPMSVVDQFIDNRDGIYD